MDKTDDCLCGKKHTWQTCCGRFLDAGEQAKTAEQLMRSRFSAYAAGGYGEYLLTTWHPATAGDLSAEELSIKAHEWCDLEILSKTQQGDKATVEFRAWYLSTEKDAQLHQGKMMQAMQEKSSFTRVQGRWLYIGGEIS